MNHPIWKETLKTFDKISFPGMTVCSAVNVSVVLSCTYKQHNNDDNGDHPDPGDGGDTSLQNCSTVYYTREVRSSKNKNHNTDGVRGAEGEREGEGEGGDSSRGSRDMHRITVSMGTVAAADDAGFGPLQTDNIAGDGAGDANFNKNGTSSRLQHCWEMNGDGYVPK